MKLSQPLFLLYFLGLPLFAMAQQDIQIKGKVVDSENKPVPGVNILIDQTGKGTSTDKAGIFRLEITQRDRDKALLFRHVRYKLKKIPVFSWIQDDDRFLEITLEDSVRVLEDVNVTDEKFDKLSEGTGTVILNPINARFNPAPFQDISNLLVTLPGVASNNEFSTAYSVRGGNYDENLVYVNDFPIYKPQIITSGQQEGLSFVNIDLVRSVKFSSGGWEAKYGDGLSSSMNIYYKRPDKPAGSVTVGLLGGTAHIEGSAARDKLMYLAGVRYKSAEYLLNTLETKGEYKPRFVDFQSYVTYDLSRKGVKNKTEIGMLLSYARNRYSVIPTNRETTFGTFERQLRLYVAFDGQEKLTYDTWQGGIRLTHRFSKHLRSHLIMSGTFSREREYYDVESGYLLCNVDNNPNSSTFEKCVTNIGIGANYYHGRNMLDATLINVESRNEVIINDRNTMEFGIGYANYAFDDVFDEYEFIDSSDYVTITRDVDAVNRIQYNRYSAYWQNTTEFNDIHTLIYGIRMMYQDFGGGWLISPRMQYIMNPQWFRNGHFRLSAGIYRQAPFYREFRGRDGRINPDLKAQSSVHSIAGMDMDFTMWGRPFRFTTEVYYKYLWDVNPYDIENVRIRYYADNVATAWASGIDIRWSGEFIPGDESWLSLGIMSTKEDIEGDDRGYIPRPMDRRVNFGIFFQDHFPNAPTWRVHLRVLYSSGLPFSPPVNPAYRNSFRATPYQRADIGFSKMFDFRKRPKPFLKSLWLSAEILNLTGNQNTISYYWVQDVNSYYYAVPNSLSQRFFNFRVSVDF